MVETYGSFQALAPGHTEYLKLAFSPSSLPLKKRWKNNGLSANFLADYIKVFLPADDEQLFDLHDSISYISNELLENAMKYGSEDARYPVYMFVYLYEQNLRIYVKNASTKENLNNFRDFIRKFEESDPAELYMQQLAESAEDDTMTVSRMGLLTIIHDHQAKVGWKIEVTDDEKAPAVITTMVELELLDE